MIKSFLKNAHALIMLRSLIAFFSFVCASSLSFSPAFAQQRMVNLYNWADYIDPRVLEDFTRETGIKVVYDFYDTAELAEARLLPGGSGYDVVVISGPMLFRLGQAKLLYPIEKAKLVNSGNLWPDIAKRLQAYDPANLHAVNYMWGTVGIGINTRLVKERLGALPLNSWDLVFKPELAAKLKDCGIHILDSAENILPAILNWMGLPGNSVKEMDLRRAGDALARIRGNVEKFHSTEYINALANGDICMVIGHSGDVRQAKKRADEARNGVEITYIIPKEGAPLWLDSMAIPVDAKNKAEAHAFIDFMLRADISARNTNFVSQASGNLPAKAAVKAEIARDTGIYPDAAPFARLFTGPAQDTKAQALMARLWARAKTGK